MQEYLLEFFFIASSISFIVLYFESKILNELNCLNISSVINPPNCTILDSLVFEHFVLADEPLAKDLQILETCISVSNNLCEKLISSLESPIKFAERFKVT